MAKKSIAPAGSFSCRLGCRLRHHEAQENPGLGPVMRVDRPPWFMAENEQMDL